MKEKQAKKHQPHIVLVDEQNRPLKVAKEERNPPQHPFASVTSDEADADSELEATPAKVKKAKKKSKSKR